MCDARFSMMAVLVLVIIINFKSCHSTNGLSFKGIIKGVKRFSRKVGQFLGVQESCSSKWIKTDPHELVSSLKNNLINQNIATLEIPKALGKFWQREIGTKNLLLCFYGSPGTGKTFTTRLISDYMFTKGDKSYYYHFYNGAESNLPHSDLNKLRNNMLESIEDAINECRHSIIVFDEADAFPRGFLDTLLAPFLLEYQKNEISPGYAIFIFLTNVGSKEVIEKSLEIHRSYFSSYTQSYYSSIVDTMKSDSKDSFFNSLIVQHGYVDNFIPFIPHTEESYVKCLERELNNFSIHFTDKHIKGTIIRNLMKDIQLIPEEDPIFVSHGCKRIISRIAYELRRMRHKEGIKGEL